MQSIHVKRYLSGQGTGWQGCVEPEDRSWILFVHDNGTPVLYRRIEIVNGSKVDGEPSKVEHVYVDAEFPCAPTVGSGAVPSEGASVALPEAPFHRSLGALDYRIENVHDEAGNPAFAAHLNCRSVAATGDTEHEAVKGLLNFVAELCTAGSLDHTGAPSHGNARRYHAVWPPGTT